MTLATRKTGITRDLALVLSLLVLGATSSDVGHELTGWAGHGLEAAMVVSDGGPDQSNSSDPTPSQVVAHCPICGVSRGSSAALGGGIASFAAVDEIPFSVFLPETLRPASPALRANAARAPPARSSA